MERAERTGLYAADPQAVYDEVVVRLLEFSEGVFERQARVQKEWLGLEKGRLNGLQCLPLFESAVEESSWPRVTESFSCRTWTRLALVTEEMS